MGREGSRGRGSRQPPPTDPRGELADDDGAGRAGQVSGHRVGAHGVDREALDGHAGDGVMTVESTNFTPLRPRRPADGEQLAHSDVEVAPGRSRRPRCP